MCRCAHAASDNAAEARNDRGSSDAFSSAPSDDARCDGRLRSQAETGLNQHSDTSEDDQTVGVSRVIPHGWIIKPAGERASVRERVRQFESNGDASCSNTVEFPRPNPSDRQSEDSEDEAPHKRRKQESDPDLLACSCAFLPLRRLERPGNEVGG